MKIINLHLLDKKYKCTDCNSTNVFYSLLVDQKENKIFFDPETEVGYCYDCLDIEEQTNEKNLEEII